MNFGEMVRALRWGWWMPTLGLLLGGLAAVAVTLTTTPVYTSHTQLFVSTTDSSSTAEAFQGNQFAEKRIASYAELLTSQELAARVVAELHLDLRSEEHTSELQSRQYLVCRLLLEKKKKTNYSMSVPTSDT